MSDPYSTQPDMDLDPSSFIMRERRASTQRTMDSLEDDPEKAARAQTLAESTGDHPALVYGDLENYEKQHKASLTSQLLSNNQYLRQYVDDHPLAAKISNDDYGQLDTVSQAVQKFLRFTPVEMLSAGVKRSIPDIIDIAKEGLHTIAENPPDTELAEATEAQAIKYGSTPEQAKRIGQTIAGRTQRANVELLTGPMQLLMSPLFGMFRANVSRPIEEATGFPKEAVEGYTMALGAALGLKAYPDSAPKLHETMTKAEPFVKAGVEPPLGVDELIDKAKIDQSKQELSAIEEAFKEAQKSATRERSPDIFANFIRQHTDAKIGVDGDAVRRLYGDKPPTPEDGILGFIPDLADQLAVGGDVHIPLADWLARVDPEVAKALHDDIRVRPGGVTKVEAEAYREQVATQKAMVEAYHGSPHDFEAFSMEKIGTGEGAQSYGHGLYFAEKRGVAESYKKSSELEALVEQLHKTIRDEPSKAAWAAKELEIANAELDKLGRGGLYRVRIHADKEQFLDWDKPLGEQHQTVQDFFTKRGAFDKTVLGEEYYARLGEELADKSLSAKEEGWTQFTQTFNDRVTNHQRASAALREAGIPGIKYLDQGSRLGGKDVATMKSAYERTLARLNAHERGVFQSDVDLAKQRYESALARHGAEPTHNFVLFDDSLIEITHKNDQAVESLRKASALDPLFDKPREAIPEQYNRGWEFTNDAGVTARIVPTEKMLAREKVLEQKANEIFARVAGVKGYEVGAADVINFHGEVVNGVYNSFAKGLPVILYSLHGDNVPRTIRHEAIHFLHDYNFFSKGEWATLEQEAIAKDWIRKHRINERYTGKEYDKAALIEESIAEEFGAWGSQRGRLDEMKEKYSTGVQAAFEKMHEFFKQIGDMIKETFGHSPAVEELFEKIETGKIAARGPGPPLRGAMDIRGKAQKGPAQGELDVTRMEHRPAFDAGTYPGLTKRQSEIISRRIAERNAEDAAKQAERIHKDEQKRQGAEWKSNRESLRVDVADEIANRPDIAADTLLRDSVLYGDKLDSPARLRLDQLTEEQRAGLPKDYVTARDGIHPDDLAGLFGYPTGDSLVDSLVRLTQAREQSGMKPADYIARLVDAETDRRMEAKYGDLAENILSAAKDHILSETQLDLLHDETLVLAEKAGQALPIKKDALKAQLREALGKLSLGDVNSDKMLAAAGKAGRAAEDAWIKQDFAEALKAKQQQTYAMHMAKLQAGVEKARDQWDRTAKKFSKREVSGVSPEYTNFIHSLLMRLDEKVRRSPEDLAEEIDKGTYKTFPDFVASKEADLRDLHVPEFLMDPAFQKPLDKLTTREFEQVHNALKAMEFNGRNELTIEKDGQAHDLKEVLDEMIGKIKTVGDKTHRIDRKPNKALESGKSWWWSGITVESMLNRLDRDNANGVFNQYIVRPFSDASNYKDKLIREYQAKVAEVGKIPDMDKLVENQLFEDPLTGQLFTMRRRNVLGILQNIGNKSNLDKLAKGYGLEPESVLSWVQRNTTKEDWDRAQRIGDIFNEIFEKANTMSRQISGVGIQRLPLEEIVTPHGTYKGWYNPVKYDPVRPGSSRKLLGPDIEEEGFYKATTPQGYTNQRTGYIAPIELTLDIVPTRMKQMLHDIAMRPAVLQISKVFYNPEFKKAMIAHYGRHQAEEMIPFLKDMANASNFKSMSESMGNQTIEYFRQNTIATLIGLNPSTVMKHMTTAAVNSLTEVGAGNFLRETMTLLGKDSATGERNWSMAMGKSEELSRRMRNYTELIQGHGSEINLRGSNSKFMTMREFVMNAGATPVSISDLMSAVPTWLAKYKTMIAEGADEGQAVFQANRAVRRAHGSSVSTNKPSIARTNALGATFSSLYGFFSHMQQKQYELAWKARDSIEGIKEGDFTDTKKYAPDLLRGFFSYIIIPAVIEELVTPYTNSEHDSWGVKVAKTLAMGVSSSFIGVRDFVRALINVRDPQAGLIGTTLKAGTDVARDLRKGKNMFNKAEAGNLLKHTFALTGVLSGLTNAQEGRAAEYLYRYYQGQEKPKGAWDVAVGLRYGKTEGHSRSFEQWKKQMIGGH